MKRIMLMMILVLTLAGCAKDEPANDCYATADGGIVCFEA